MISIAILGFGNIGSGVAEVLKRNQDKIRAAVGDEVFVKYVLDKRDLSQSEYADRAVLDIDIIMNDPEVSVVCEMLGGTQPAYDFSMAALKAGKSVVTSNKEVVARFGVALLETARENGVHYLYEASVGGGIPILHAMDDSLKGCHIHRIDGILNGTTNYILTRMHDCASSFSDALDEARKLGYAEANPTADI
ncbi:MAG: homoserine dehydrogenase [Clostridia bacterium]|nr:homoserine dehydrogenase [Clostridia bacterium]